MTEAVTVYRRSALEDSDCLHRLKALWLDGVPDDSDYALFGQAFHEISHRYVLRLVARGLEADADEARAAFAEGIAAHQTPMRLIPELRELWMRHAEVFTLDLTKFLAAEQRLELHGVSGALDLVYADPQTLEVIDWKTFHVMLTETEARQSFQARIYTLLARERFPHFPMYRFTFWFVRFNKAVSVVFTPAELDQAELEAEAAIARIEEAKRTDSWPAQAGPACGYCQLQCPLAEEAMTLPVRLLPGQAEPAAAWLTAAQQGVAAVKKALKAYCVANGPVNVHGLEWANRPVVERAYPLDMVLEQLSRMTPPSELDQTTNQLTLSHSALKKLFKVYVNLEANLATVCREKTTYRFGAKAAGQDDEQE